MIANLKCFTCAIGQALSAIEHTKVDQATAEKVLKAIAVHYGHKEICDSPARYAQDVYELVSQLTKVADPFAKEKIYFNNLALSMVEDCKIAIANSKDPLSTGTHLAVAGNIIDLGIVIDLEIHKTLATALEKPFGRTDLSYLKRELSQTKSLLYLGDNAGEIVFDKLFIEIIQDLYPQIDITFAVKSGPIINDATMADAQMIGLDNVCRIIDVGAACIGVPPDMTSKSFKQEFESADLIISKGQGNFETLSSFNNYNIFFILKAKCLSVAQELGVCFGDSVLKHVTN